VPKRTYKPKEPKSLSPRGGEAVRTKKVEDVAAQMKSTKKRRDNSANLGNYLYKSKMPTGSKIGAASTSRKTTKRQMLNKRGQKGTHLNV